MSNLAITHFALSTVTMHTDENGVTHPCLANLYYTEDDKYEPCPLCVDQYRQEIRDTYEEDDSFRMAMDLWSKEQDIKDAIQRNDPAFLAELEEYYHD